MPLRRSLHASRFTRHALLAVLTASPASAQLIGVKTLPIAIGDQFAFFPSANDPMGGVSIALADSLLDPFVNPAKGARLRALEFFGSPTFYSISRNGGGGQTLPIGALLSNGRFFGGAVVATQQINPSRSDANAFSQQVAFPQALPPGAPSFGPPEQGRSKYNRYAYATLGSRAADGLSFAGSVLYADLHRVDGVDQLYAGSQSINQYGGEVDARFGVVRDWTSGASLEAIVLFDRLAMTHDVTFADAFYDPNRRTISSHPRVDRNLDRTNTWGMHLAWQRPVGDSGWRVGAILTGNLLTHPKLPNYQIVDVVRPVPWDPGHSAASNLGIGVAQRKGPSTFALDLIYEPIATHTWGEAPSDLQTASGGIIAAGGRTTENHFTFSNAIARIGVGQDVPLEGVPYPLRFQAGVSAHAIHYWLHQDDHVQETSRRQSEQWVEWAPTWGVSMRFGDVDVHYVGRSSRGTGRPGLASSFNAPNVLAAADVAGPSIVAAPSGPINLTPVSITTHQFSISVPLR
jgi:hypothetical protein